MMPPIGAKSNMRNEIRPSSAAVELTSKFVEVPIKVQHPPRMEAKESGMSSLDGLMFRLAARPVTMGRKSKTTGVLLTNAEVNATRGRRTRRMGPIALPDKAVCRRS